MRPLCGKPLVQHAIDAARNSGRFEQVVVTSDDDEVLLLAERLGAVPLRRPAVLASNSATMSDVVAHVGDVCGEGGIAIGEVFALLQPTTPLRTAQHVAQCVERFEAGDYASAVSICALDHPPQKALTVVDGKVEPLLGWDALQANRQSLPAAYRQNGAIWIVTWDAFRAQRRFVVAPAMPFIMEEADSVDIDTLADFQAAEAALAKRANEIH